MKSALNLWSSYKSEIKWIKIIMLLLVNLWLIVILLNDMNITNNILLTIGVRVIMGGMFYMNNVGILNIGSMLTRFGIGINSSINNIQQPVSNEPITQAVQNKLGKNLIEILYVLI